MKTPLEKQALVNKFRKEIKENSTIAYCEKHKTEYPKLLWCQMCLIEENDYLEELQNEEISYRGIPES